MDARLQDTSLMELRVAFENIDAILANIEKYGVTPSVMALVMHDPVMKSTLEGLQDDEILPAVEGLMDKVIDKFKSLFKKPVLRWNTYKDEMNNLNDKITERIDKGRVTDDLEITAVDLSLHMQNMQDAVKRCEWVKTAVKKVASYKGSASDEEATVMMARLAYEGGELIKKVNLPPPSKTTCGRAGFPEEMNKAQEIVFEMMDSVSSHSDATASIFRGISRDMVRLWHKHDLAHISTLIEGYIPTILMADLKTSFKSVVLES